MEKRLGRLEVLHQAGRTEVIEQASWDIQWAVQWPTRGDTGHAARIRDAHPLDDAGITRAIEVALTRCGLPRGEAQQIATLGLERVGEIAAEGMEVA